MLFLCNYVLEGQVTVLKLLNPFVLAVVGHRSRSLMTPVGMKMVADSRSHYYLTNRLYFELDSFQILKGL